MAFINRDKVYIVHTASGTTVASGYAAHHVEGWLKRVYIAAPSTSGDVSGTLTLHDHEDIQIWSFGVCISSESTSGCYVTAADVPFQYGYYFKNTFGNVPGCATGASAVPLTATLTIFVAE